MTTTIKLTAAQAMMRWLSVQMTDDGERFIEGVWAIFGHGNVAGIGEALHGMSKALPTWRGRTSRPWPMPQSPMRRASAAAVRMP
jgi:3D-(3,5/4)-trihydroxycyclohexane-1,2-dione acylhydrolase (decyclizing)